MSNLSSTLYTDHTYNYRSEKQYGLLIFLIASIFVHAIFFQLSNTQQLKPNIINEHGSPLINIALTPKEVAKKDTHSPKPAQQSKKSIKPIAIPKAEQKKHPPSPVIAKERILVKNPEPAPVFYNATKKSPQTSTKKERNTLETPPHKATKVKNKQNEALALIKHELYKHFTYPRQALRRKLQGQVNLVFDISHDGIIKNITILKSSGHRILDNAAIKAIRKINGKVELKLLVKKDINQLTLPVTYKIKN